jgi:hexosaminidase
MYALSEIAWTSLDNKNYANFAEQRVPKHLALLDKTNTVYRVPTALGVKDTLMSGSQFSFNLKPPVIGSKIYYTINGYTPRETDRQYSAGFDIKVPAGERRILKTLVITPSGKRSAVTTTTLVNETTGVAPATASPRNSGLKYFFVPGDFESVSQIDTLKATDRGVLPTVNVAKFRGKSRTYGVVLSGYINIDKDGLYNFSTTSDDGSQLWIDDKLVVQNDGKHFNFETNGVANLLKGYHKMEIRYFQAGGSNELKAYVVAPGKAKQEITAAMLFN